MTTTATPAYLVCHSHKAAPFTRTFFTNDNLLTARKAAYTFVESLFATRIDDYVGYDETEVYLVEITDPDDPSPTIIARLLHQSRFDAKAQEDPTDSKRKLLELQQEFAYYQAHHHPIGFGAFSVWLQLQSEASSPQVFTILGEAIGALMAGIATYGSVWRANFTFTYYQPNDPIKLVPLPC